MRVWKRWGGLWALVALLVGCAQVTAPASGGVPGASPVAPSAPKLVTAISSGNPPGLDNRFVVTSNNANRVILPLYSGSLILFDATGGVKKEQLAEAIPSLDNGLWAVFPDNTMETRLTIRAGTKWHDGVPLTTRDVLFNDEVYRNKNLPQIVISARNYVEQMTALDDRTLAIRWREPYIFADAFSPDLLPAHLLETTYRENDEALLTSPWLSSEYVGTGPFKLKEFQPSSYVYLTAFGEYVLGRPRVDELLVKFIPDATTMLANILSGAADLTLSSSPSVEQAVQLQQQQWDGQIGMFSVNWIHFFAQYIDPVHPVLTDKRFRKGLMLSLDRQTYVDTIQHGWGGVVDIPLLQTDPSYAAVLPHAERYPYDPGRAAEMFAQAGLAKGPDGFLRLTASGQRLDQIEFRTTAEQDVQVRLLAAMSDNFKDAGLDIRQVAIPQNRTADRLYRVTNPGFEELSGGLGPASFIGWMHSSKVPTAENGYTSGNYPRYSNRDWDALIERYAVTIPLDQRLQVMIDLVKHVQDNLMDVGVIYSTHPQFATKRLSVPQAYALWTPESWDIR